MYEVKKAPQFILDKGVLKTRGVPLPIPKMKKGDMIEMENLPSNRTKAGNAIKSFKLSPAGKDTQFTIHKIDENIIAVIRLS